MLLNEENEILKEKLKKALSKNKKLKEIISEYEMGHLFSREVIEQEVKLDQNKELKDLAKKQLPKTAKLKDFLDDISSHFKNDFLAEWVEFLKESLNQDEEAFLDPAFMKEKIPQWLIEHKKNWNIEDADALREWLLAVNITTQFLLDALYKDLK